MNVSIDREQERRPIQKIRPLGTFSNKIADGLLGNINQGILEGRETRDFLFYTLETDVREISSDVFSDLHGIDLNIAFIDLLFGSRSVQAFTNSREDTKNLQNSMLFQRFKELAERLGRLPTLTWRDTSREYFDLFSENNDFRSFLAQGPDRKDEVNLYMINGRTDTVCIENILKFQKIDRISEADLEESIESFKIVVIGLGEFSGRRARGHFDKLATFSESKIDRTIVPSGGLDALLYLFGFAATENPHLKERLENLLNERYFERDALSLIEKLKKGEFRTVKQIIAQAPESKKERLTEKADELADIFRKWTHVHEAAVRIHAQNQLFRDSPAYPGYNPPVGNLESIRRSREGIKIVRRK